VAANSEVEISAAEPETARVLPPSGRVCGDLERIHLLGAVSFRKF
jgi:hypothetical protein